MRILAPFIHGIQVHHYFAWLDEDALRGKAAGLGMLERWRVCVRACVWSG